MKILDSLCHVTCRSPVLVQLTGAKKPSCPQLVRQDPGKDLPAVAYTVP